MRPSSALFLLRGAALVPALVLACAGPMWLAPPAATLAAEPLPAPGERVKLPPVEPPTPREMDEARDRGLAFLLQSQNKDGSWGTAERTKGLNILASVPGSHRAFRAAVTALCVSALVETAPGRDDVRAAIARGEAWMCEHLPQLRRATPMELYNVWGHGYAIETFARLHDYHEGNSLRQAEMKRQIGLQIELLERYETVNGGWGYYDFDVGAQKSAGSPTSFTTATILIALDRARRLGVSPPTRLVDRALASMRRQAKPDLSFVYGEYLNYRPQHPVNLPGGSLGRTQVCLYCLRLYNDDTITNGHVTQWLDRLFARNMWLDIGRKRPIPHEAWFAVAGYFFYYGHYYAAFAIELLPEDERAEHQARLARVILPLQEKDGSWWDFPFYNYHQPYGTAFALLTLHHCRGGAK